MAQPPVRYPSGVSTSPRGANPNSLFRNYPAEHPSRLIRFHNDFFSYAAGDYTITQTGGSAALVDGSGGLLALTASTGGTDSIFMQHAKISWYPSAGNQLWFDTRIKMDAVSTGNMIIGLVAQDTTPLTNTDGLYFIKSTAGTGVLSFVQNASSTATTNTATTLVADTFVRLGFYYNGKDAVEYFVDGLKVGTNTVTNLPSAGMTFTMGVAATSAVARVLTVDYVSIANERYTPANP